MENNKSNLISRRKALISLATITAGTLIKPTSILAAYPTKAKTRFAIMGDWGTGGDDEIGLAKQMFQTHKKEALEFILTVGDNIYPNGSARHFEKNFQQPFADLIKENVPFFATLGNHDVQDGRNDQINYPYFNMGGQNYYTVSKGNGLVDFFMLDSTDFSLAQVAWLENMLHESRAKWKIAITHHPLYSSGKNHGSEMKLRKQLEPILTRYGVHAVFSGHDHIYERTLPQQGIQYFVTGAGGKMRRGGVNLKSPFRAVSYDEDNQFMVIELDEREVRFEAVSEMGQVVDKGIIKQV